MMSCLRWRATPSMPICCESLSSSGAGICFSSVRFMNFVVIALRWCSAQEFGLMRTNARASDAGRSTLDFGCGAFSGFWSVRRLCGKRLRKSNLSWPIGTVHLRTADNSAAEAAGRSDSLSRRWAACRCPSSLPHEPQGCVLPVKAWYQLVLDPVRPCGPCAAFSAASSRQSCNALADARLAWERSAVTAVFLGRSLHAVALSPSPGQRGGHGPDEGV